MTYILVGGPFTKMDTEYKGEFFGQSLELPEDVARSVIAEGAALLPKDAFDSCGFNAEEIAKYPNARAQANAPATFHAKHAAALQSARDYRAQLSAPQRAATAAPGNQQNSKDKS